MGAKRRPAGYAGTLKSFNRTADIGKPLTGVFCPDCGIRIYNIPSLDQKVYLLKPGTLDGTAAEAHRPAANWPGLPPD